MASTDAETVPPNKHISLSEVGMARGTIAFFNVQRAGVNSDYSKLKRAEALVNFADLTVFAEVMQKCPMLDAQAFTYGKTTSGTLCYAAYSRDRKACAMEAVDVEVPDAFAEQVKGGKDPSAHFNRKMIELKHNYANWPRVFAIHANAAKGEKVATICALHLEKLGGPWILIGDLNVEPQKLESWLDWFDADVNIAHSKESTHASVRPASAASSSSVSSELGTFAVSEKVLDYGLYSNDLVCSVVRVRKGKSDHDAVLLKWEKA